MKITQFINALKKRLQPPSVSDLIGEAATDTSVTPATGSQKPVSKKRASQTPVSQTPVSPEVLRRRLLDFADDTTRGDPVIFAGREKQVNFLKNRLEGLWEKWRAKDPGEQAPWKGETVIVQGAPGAGKTALLDHLETLEFEVRETGKMSPVTVCYIEDENVLEDKDLFEQTIADAWIPGAGARMAATTTRQKSITAKAHANAGVNTGVLNVGAGSAAEGSEGSSTTGSDLHFSDVIKDVRGDPDKYPPMLLMIDEAQALKSEAGPQLFRLYKGKHGLPIIPVYGGLAWTAERLARPDIGISRLGKERVHTLGALSKDECGEVVDAFYSEYHIIGTPEEKEWWKNELVERSQGWPQHLQGGLTALAWELGKEEVDRRLGQASRETVFDKEEKIRHEYYDARISSFELNYHGLPHLAAAVVAYLGKDNSGQLDLIVLGDALDRGYVKNLALKWPKMNLQEDDVRLNLPKGLAGKDFVRSMFYAGIFHKGEHGVLHVPIPSFARYLCSELDWLAGKSGETPQPDPPEPAPPISGPGM